MRDYIGSYVIVKDAEGEKKKKLPGQLGEIATLPGLGPKRVKLLYDKLKVRTLDDRHVIKKGRLHELRGFGPVIE